MALIQGCKENNRDAQQGMYNLLAGFAVAICERYAGNREEAEELVQEGFLKLFKNIERFDPGRHQDQLLSIKGWFKRILVNTCIDHFRRNKHEATKQPISDQLDLPETGQATAVDQISYKELVQAIQLLSPGYRQVFNMYVMEGMSHDEIAQALGISAGTSKSNLSKAREKMKKILASISRIKVYV